MRNVSHSFRTISQMWSWRCLEKMPQNSQKPIQVVTSGWFHHSKRNFFKNSKNGWRESECSRWILEWYMKLTINGKYPPRNMKMTKRLSSKIHTFLGDTLFFGRRGGRWLFFRIFLPLVFMANQSLSGSCGNLGKEWFVIVDCNSSYGGDPNKTKETISSSLWWGCWCSKTLLVE